MIVPTNESEENIKKYEDLRIKIRYLIKSVTEKSDDYDKKYMRIISDTDDKLPLKENHK